MEQEHNLELTLFHRSSLPVETIGFFVCIYCGRKFFSPHALGGHPNGTNRSAAWPSTGGWSLPPCGRASMRQACWKRRAGLLVPKSMLLQIIGQGKKACIKRLWRLPFWATWTEVIAGARLWCPKTRWAGLSPQALIGSLSSYTCNSTIS